MSRLEDVIRRGTRAAQPAANLVAIGTLYFVTAENVLERSNGTIWENCSSGSGGSFSSGGGGISILLDYPEEPNESLIIPGPVGLTGATGAAGAIGIGIRGFPGIDGEDGETILIPGIPGAIGPQGPAGGGSSDWDATVTKSSDQTVTNNATPQNDTELKFTPVSGAVYLVEIIILYTGNSSLAGFAWQFGVPISVNDHIQGWWSGVNASSGSTFTSSVGTGTNSWPASITTMGTSVNEIFPFTIRFTITTNATTAIQFKFCNVNSGAGRDSICKASSFLRYKRLV